MRSSFFRAEKQLRRAGTIMRQCKRSTPAGLAFDIAWVPSLIRSVFDPAWLFLLSGLAMLAACVLVPAQDRFGEARWQRDRAQTMLAHEQLKAERYELVAGALERGDEALITTLVASQLNLVPAGSADQAAIVLGSSRPDADILRTVEPDIPTLPVRRIQDTRLRRLVIDENKRLWLLIGGCICAAIGLFRRTSGF